MKRYEKLLLPLTFLTCAIPSLSDSAWTYGVSETEGWYDYNKSYNGDENMCWAASASNILSWWQDNSTYTRYASSQTPYGSQIWDTFRDSFTNEGGHSYYAYEWYFLGTYEPLNFPKDEDYDWALPKNSTNIGGGYYRSAETYFSDERMTESVANTDEHSYSSYYYYFSSFIVEALNNNYALSLSISNLGGNIYEQGTLAHAMTMWGCDYTTDADGNIAIQTLYITDSDDDNFSDLKTVSCYDFSLADGEEEQFCFSSEYYNSDTSEGYGDFYITDITGLNLLEAIPEPSSVVLVLAGLPFVLRRKRR